MDIEGATRRRLPLEDFLPIHPRVNPGVDEMVGHGAGPLEQRTGVVLGLEESGNQQWLVLVDCVGAGFVHDQGAQLVR